MNAVLREPGCRFGSHRVIDPPGALPQTAWKLDNRPEIRSNEMLCAVETLNLDSASFRQIAEMCGRDAGAIAAHVLATVAERGKQHNAVTGSGGMFVGRVLEVGESLGQSAPAPGTRIASLVSLTLTPLRLEAIEAVDVATGQLTVRGTAVLFESAAFTQLPDDLPTRVTLAVLDVAGAPAQVARLAAAGSTVCVIGADGKSGLLCCAQARASTAPDGRVVGIVPDAETPGARLLRTEGLVDALLEADARDALAVQAAISAMLPDLADVVVNCVNVPGTELASILCCRERGTVYFFSMATSFTAAALGAEGVGKDVAMMIGNGYARGHAELALQKVRERPALAAYFSTRYGVSSAR
ncbi:MAG: L-erythro-3,5-diaminohexanoate dehydrogenase [Candidatus Eremiobacteraeota bacterium]|nr:L-erythro-3,5-diaminohexanoate dehydrogenase [Candidatus Eremiobacteraeota bacterium]